MKILKAFVFLALIFGLSYQKAQSDYYQNIGWEVLESNTQEIVLRYKPIIIGFDTIYTKEGSRTILPIIKAAFQEQETPGTAMKFIVSINITVPSVTGFSLDSYNVSSVKRINERITPIPNYINIDGNIAKEYSIQENSYRVIDKDEQVVLEYSGISRSRHIAKLSVISAEYDPLTNSIIIPEAIDIKISFAANSNIRLDKRLKSDMDIPISINHQETKSWRAFQNSSAHNSIIKSKNAVLQGFDNQPLVKIKISSEGLYQITPSLLEDLGYSISKDEIASIKIYGTGGLELSEEVIDALSNAPKEQEIIVKTKGNGELDKIIFYGSAVSGFKYDSVRGFEHYLNDFSNYNYYLLTWAGTDGKRAKSIETPSEDVVNKPNYYTNRIFYNEQLYNAYIGGSGRYWFGRNLLPATFSEQLYNLDRSKDILYKVSVAHRASYSGIFNIDINGKNEIDIFLSKVTGYYDAYRDTKSVLIPASSTPNDNRTVIQFNYTNNSGSSAGLSFFDYYEIHYPSYFIPIENQISFFTNPELNGLTEYTINNFSGNDIFGFDVSNPVEPKLIENISVTGNMFIFRTLLKEKNSKKFFITGTLKQPQIMKTEITDLFNGFKGADVILITHPLLLESAIKYKEYRESNDNLTVSIVRTDQIYNEFACGLPDPTAVRDMIAKAFEYWENKPEYVLLWGDGHYDYKMISTQEINFVPTYQTKDNVNSYYELNTYTTDDFFANIAGDDFLMDVAIGRVPIYSLETGNLMVEKIEQYENGSADDTWRTSMTIVADDSWRTGGADGTLHTGQAEDLWRDILPDDFQIKKMYLPEYPTENVTGGKRKPKVMEDIISTTNISGNLFLCFIGHGNPRVWTHEEVFERSITTPQLRNPTKQFFVSAASCDFGRFDALGVRSGAEELLLSKFGGAIGAFTSTRLVLSTPNADLNEVLYSNFFKRNTDDGSYLRMGEVVNVTKIVRYRKNDRKFCLLGDPTIRLLIPDYKVSIDSINGRYVKDNRDTVRIAALSTANLSGRITYPSSTITDTTFNGVVIISMLDSDQSLEVYEDDGTLNGTIHRIVKNGGALNRSSYKVENGLFTAQFIIPIDISFSGEAGRIYAYAHSEDYRQAKGNSNNFILNGITSNPRNDIKGPDINIYLDSRDFVAGALVRCVPLLIIDMSDASGLNTTGLGLGHRIEAWIDDNPNSIDLTNKFSTSLEDSRSGTVEELLFNLEPGLHTIKVRAWDVYNNYSISEAMFRTTSCDGITISNLISYPNPTTGKTTFSFAHNVSPPFEVEIKLFNYLGQMMESIKTDVNSVYRAEIEWDGLDDKGNELNNGNYLYKITIKTYEGIVKSSGSVMTIIR